MPDLLGDIAAEAAAQHDFAGLRERIRRQDREIEKLTKLFGLLERIDRANVESPRWTRQYKGKAGKRGIATYQLSDTHFDEVVNPAEIAFINAYDRRIAELRLRRWVDKGIALARDYISGIEYDGAAIFATGDILSGDIHEELKESNESTVYDAAVHWTGQLSAAIRLMADEWGKLHIAVVVGNHGRNSRKPVYKHRAQSNIEWLMWRFLAREFAADKRVTFQISDSMDLTVRLYGTNYLITHGDEFRGGSGIQGARAPLALGQHRTGVRQQATQQPMDYMVVGHFHQYQPPSQGLVMGGSLKGYDEYAFGKRFRPEPARQAFWVTSPEYGPTISAPVHVQDRKSEGW
jgi:predicted phosphodiesterase